MCTVTIIPLSDGGVRLITNRDERRERAPAFAPEVRESADGLRSLSPLDPAGGGTWVSVTEHGVVLALLNANPRRPVPAPGAARSRGLVIPTVQHIRRARDIGGAVAALDAGVFAPFRLVTADRDSIGLVEWDGERLTGSGRGLAPVCFVSSGLGDHRVVDRLALFDAWIGEHGATREAQDAFHRHRWPDRPEVSVMMSRADARTVSITEVEVTRAGSLVMMYRDDAGDHEAHLARRESVAVYRA